MTNGSILNKEMRRKAQGSPSWSMVLVIENRERNQKKRREKSISKSKFRYKNMECHFCHKIRHMQKHCKKDKSKEKDHDDDDDDDRVTTATNNDLSVNLISDESVWIIDSGAIVHVTPRKELFTS
ncbi:hypothetical protein CR513_30070, partial [Mucuna pruriens]